MAGNNNFSFVTYNLDCRPFDMDMRLDFFIKYIEELDPTILVIQEGTKFTYEKLNRELSTLGYNRRFLNILRTRKCGEMIYSKNPITKITYFKFDKGSDNKGLTIAEIDMWDKKVYAVTCQFDTPMCVRKDQLIEMEHLLKTEIPSGETVIFGGDTQILNRQKHLTPPKGWYDAWYEAHSVTGKYTIDHETNPYVSAPFRERPDRIWYQPSFTNPIICEQCNVITHNDGDVISSHYGVMSIFSFEE